MSIPVYCENYTHPSMLSNLPAATLYLSNSNYQNVHARKWPRSKADPVSASRAGTLNLDDGYSISVSLSRSERMPSVREIYASSNSLATNSFETGLIKGSGSLQKYPDTIETAKAVNLTLRKATGRTRFEQIGRAHV